MLHGPHFSILEVFYNALLELRKQSSSFPITNERICIFQSTLNHSQKNAKENLKQLKKIKKLNYEYHFKPKYSAVVEIKFENALRHLTQTMLTNGKVKASKQITAHITALTKSNHIKKKEETKKTRDGFPAESNHYLKRGSRNKYFFS